MLGAVTLLPMGCAELRTPQASLPGVLQSPGQGGLGPLRTSLDETAAAFADQGAGLAGRPAAAALALARLEALTELVYDQRRFPEIPAGTGLALRVARDESRAALGAARGASTTDVQGALTTTASALRRGDQAATTAALRAPLFEPGGAATLERLGALGPLPAAEQATADLVREVRRLDAVGGWSGGGDWWQAGAPGVLTDGLGRGI